MKFLKPPETSKELFIRLLDRGLIVQQEEKTIHYIEHIGYYRLSGYMYPFQFGDGSHKFKPDVSFDLVLNHYLFDKKLRFLILEVLERIEISVRSTICNVMALSYGSHWYLNASLFNDASLHDKMLVGIKSYCSNCNEIFIKSYYYKYSEPEYPPCWMILETFTFGQITSLYENLKDTDEKKEIANKYKILVMFMESWLKSLNFIRNCCAHHARLWNRKLPLKPKLPRRDKYRFLKNVNIDTDKQLFGALSCILFLLQSINPESKFKERLQQLFEEYPMVYTGYMGFPEDWKSEEIWK